MDLWDIVKVMWRRWYVVAPLLLVVLAATVGAGTVLKPEYTSTASVLLVPPADPPSDTPGRGEKANPWIHVGPVAMAEAVAIAVQSKTSRDQVAAEGIDATYLVGVLPRSSIVQIEIAATTPEQVQAAATRVIQLIHDEVAKRQEPYRPKPGQEITSQVLDPGDNVAMSRTGARRGQAMILFAGLLFTAGLAVGIDALVRRRRKPGMPPGTPGRPDDATITLPVVNVPAYDPARR